MLEFLRVMSFHEQIESLLNVISYLLQKIDPSEQNTFDSTILLDNFQKHFAIIDGPKSPENELIDTISEKCTKEELNPETESLKDTKIDYEKEEAKTSDARIDGVSFSENLGENCQDSKLDQGVRINCDRDEKEPPEVETKSIYPEDKKSFKALKSDAEDSMIQIYKCVFCKDLEFSSFELMNSHDDEKHKKSGQYICMECPLISDEKKYIVDHFMQYHCNANIDTQSFYECEICKGCFSKIFSLNEHLTMVHDLQMPKSVVKCDKRFTVLYCVQCKKSFPTAGKSNYHMHTRHGNIRCSQCDKRFATMNQMKNHYQLIHVEGPKKFQCHICGKEFNSAAMQKDHIENRHNQKEKTFQCEKCDKSYFTKMRLQHHTYENHSGKIHQCTECTYASRSKTRFQRHALTHSNEKPFQCNECGWKFKIKDTMKQHIRIVHGNERRYKCDQCDKAFKTSHHLKAHLKIHKGEFGAHCSGCGKGFIQAHNYKLHLKKHPECNEPQDMKKLI